MTPIRRVIALIGLAVALLSAAPAIAGGGDIVDYFAMYYSQQVAGEAHQGTLDFLHDAAAAHATTEQVLKAGKSRKVIVDRRNGYLQIDDSSDTDQILTMAVYTKADGSSLLVVGSADCADACILSVQFFVVSADRLQPVARDSVVPTIAPAEFIKPGQPMPKALATITPAINYVPARVGTALTLTPWYGYETEEQMTRATRNAIRNVTLAWDAKQGRFVKARTGS